MRAKQFRCYDQLVLIAFIDFCLRKNFLRLVIPNTTHKILGNCKINLN